MTLKKIPITEKSNLEEEIELQLEKVALHAPRILLPNQEIVDPSLWAVIACDQYGKHEWDQARKKIGKNPTTMDFIFPEAYLDGQDEVQLAQNTSSIMQQYLDSGVFLELPPGFILVDRQTPYVKSRKGLIVAIDLEQYSSEINGKETLIRETEKAIPSRLPIRKEIRKHAPIETTHVIVLIDDPEEKVIESLFKDTRIVNEDNKLYDFELIMGGGHIRGYGIFDPSIIHSIGLNLDSLLNPTLLNKKYGVSGSKGRLLYETGDGNHSLLTAYVHWDNLKKSLLNEGHKIEEVMKHPARYALVELVNIHGKDENGNYSLPFHPISRILYDVKIDIPKILKDFGYEFTYHQTSQEQMKKEIDGLSNGTEQKVGIVNSGKYHILEIHRPKSDLSVITFQALLDSFIENGFASKIGYEHNYQKIVEAKGNNFGFYFPVLGRDILIRTVVEKGLLPEKSFSLGETPEKKFYFECRKIIH